MRLSAEDIGKLYLAMHDVVRNFIATQLACSVLVRMKRKYVRIRINVVEKEDLGDDRPNCSSS